MMQSVSFPIINVSSVLPKKDSTLTLNSYINANLSLSGSKESKRPTRCNIKKNWPDKK